MHGENEEKSKNGLEEAWLKKICIKHVEGEKNCKECNKIDFCEDWVRDKFHSMIG